VVIAAAAAVILRRKLYRVSHPNSTASIEAKEAIIRDTLTRREVIVEAVKEALWNKAQE